MSKCENQEEALEGPDCEIFANLCLHFVWSSSARSTDRMGGFLYRIVSFRNPDHSFSCSVNMIHPLLQTSWNVFFYQTYNWTKQMLFPSSTVGWGGGPSLHKGINPVKRGIFRPLACPQPPPGPRHTQFHTRVAAENGSHGSGRPKLCTELQLQWTVTLLIIFYARLLSDLDTNHDVHRYIDTWIDISHWLLDTIHDMHAWPWQCWWWRKLNGM